MLLPELSLKGRWPSGADSNAPIKVFGISIRVRKTLLLRHSLRRKLHGENPAFQAGFRDNFPQATGQRPGRPPELHLQLTHVAGFQVLRWARRRGDRSPGPGVRAHPGSHVGTGGPCGCGEAVGCLGRSRARWTDWQPGRQGQRPRPRMGLR